jgi:ubiquinone biosynthesis monooxygenase Coq6
MMAAIDKLHKIYSSTSEPLVWVRSVGVEVLNEIDSFKAALMYAAGANPGNPATGARGRGWAQAAVGIESLARSVNTAKLVGDGVVGGLGFGLQKLFNSVSQQHDDTSQTRNN